MQDPLHLQFFDENEVVCANRIRYENKSLVVNLCADVIAHPILIVEVEQPGVDWLDDGMTPGRDCFQKMTQDCRLLLFTLLFAVPLACHQRIFNRKLIVVDQNDFPFFQARESLSYHGQRYILDGRYFNIFLHAYSASLAKRWSIY